MVRMGPRLLVLAVGVSLCLTSIPRIAVAATLGSLSAGDNYTCALDDGGAVSCWGHMPAEIAAMPPGPFTSIAAGQYHACGIRPAGSIECWGNPIVEALDPPDGQFLEVSVGAYHSCAVRTDQQLVCWAPPQYASILNPPAGAFHGLSSGGNMACALDIEDAIECWGDLVPNGPPAGAFRSVDVGLGAACALREDSSVVCWGLRTPHFYGAYTAVSSGTNADCALRTDGDIDCVASYGGPPAQITGPFDQISVGTSHVCARYVTGSLECWGATDNPTFGVQPAITSPIPPTAWLGAPYVHTLATSAVIPRVGYSVSEGVLPEGLSLSADGQISGTPTALDSGDVTVMASNAIAPTAEQTFAMDVQVDSGNPVVSNVTTLPLTGSRISNGWIQVHVAWTGSDAESGVGRYELEREDNAGPWKRLGSFIQGQAMDLWLAPWHTYDVRIRAVDKVGNIGPWAASGPLRIVPYQDSNSSVVYSGTWSTATSDAYFGGSMRSSFTANASASLDFTGQWFTWVGAVGPTRGSARVYVDGSLRATISLYAASGLPRKLLYSQSWPISGQHTVKVVVVYGSGNSQADLDAFLAGM